MPEPVDQRLLDQAVELAREAGKLTLRWFGSDDLGLEHKGDGTPVTAADRAAERFIREQLADLHPTDGIIGEEEGDTPGSSERSWIIDPIDGTKAFTHGVPLYTNLLALEDEQGTAVGVINIPALDETVYAGRGLGCWCNGVRTRVTDRTDLAGSWLMTSGFGPWEDEAFVRIRAADVHLRTWGDAYGYALVATGRADAMVDPVVAVWDVGPMPVILEEAGGRFTDYAGDVTLRGGSGVASNGHLHEAVRSLLNGG